MEYFVLLSVIANILHVVSWLGCMMTKHGRSQVFVSVYLVVGEIKTGDVCKGFQVRLKSGFD